ncbi:MAG: bifunctional oligoribonuclease/PAP phosphatase NrnA [Candidatus Promineifilaceae bacterium]|nr:bifunctional oligoribonuclease/PAP phosphatase NrnA [Candidatus Promineifilaceae bacterium]
MIQHILEKAENILVVTHVDPDGDAFGSLTAMGLALAQSDLRVSLVCDDNVPERFDFLPLVKKVQNRPSQSIQYDLLIAVDCGDEFRMGMAYASLPTPKPFIINIDHHVTNTQFGNINLVKPDASSTTEILYRLFVDMGVEITSELATSLLTGLVTDTLCFRTVGVSAETLRVGSDLVEAGADLGFITMRALNVRPFSTLKLWRTGMNKMSLEKGLLWTSINSSEREAANFRSNSSVGLVNLLADVNEAAMGAVLMELSDGSIKVGLRCRPPFNVAEVAIALGGGGHPLASGCTLPGPLDEAENILVKACQEAIDRQSAALPEIEMEVS